MIVLNSTEDILHAAHLMLADVRRWTKGSNGRDQFGQPVSALSPDAVCFCAQGAVQFFMGGELTSCLSALEALDRVVPPEKRCGLFMDFNDKPETTHDDVLTAFRLAIEQASA